MSNPEYAKVGEKVYKINTDFKVALRCEEVALDKSIDDTERALAIIYLLYGEAGLNSPEDYEVLIEKAGVYLGCGKKTIDSKEKPDMDFEQDKSYIKASFFTDYNIPDIYKTDMHWWDFIDLMNGLKEDCVLNRVREIRNYDTSGIKDAKTLEQIRKQKQAVALRRKEHDMTEEEKKGYDEFSELVNRLTKRGD